MRSAAPSFALLCSGRRPSRPPPLPFCTTFHLSRRSVVPLLAAAWPPLLICAAPATLCCLRVSGRPAPQKTLYISPKYTVCVVFGVTHIGGTVQTPHKQSSTPAGMQMHACCVRLCLSVSLHRAKSTRTFKRTIGVRVTASHMSQHHLGGGGSLFCFLCWVFCTVTLTHICQGDSVWRCKTAA